MRRLKRIMRNVMSWIKSALIAFVPLSIIIFGLEFGARLLLGKFEGLPRDFSGYTDVELDRTLPFIYDQNGADCISFNSAFHWNQWWGYSAKNLDIQCAKSFFSEETFNVVFMGGSAMFNAEAPNYLTTLEYLATSDIERLRSINLAESGARHMNMSIRFQREVIQLEPDLVIFFDGYNEFNSLLYNGSPLDDFYWTATGKVRMHRPYRLYVDKAIELSSFLELALIHTGIYRSARNVRDVNYDAKLVNEASLTYLRDMSVTSSLCESHGIKCVFIIQPHVYGSKLPEHAQIISAQSTKFPADERIRVDGYARILNGCGLCVDMSSLLDDLPNSFLDPVHFGKDGSQRLGSVFRKLILEEIKSQSLPLN